MQCGTGLSTVAVGSSPTRGDKYTIGGINATISKVYIPYWWALLAPPNSVVGSALPVSITKLTIASCLFSEAYDSTFWPYLFFEFTSSALPVSTRHFTIVSCPFFVADDSGVRSSLAFELTSALLVSTRNLPIVSRPVFAASDSGSNRTCFSCLCWPCPPQLEA